MEQGDDKKKQKRGGKGALKAKKKTEPGAVKIGRMSRGKKKSVTHITGLATYDVSYKKLRAEISLGSFFLKKPPPVDKPVRDIRKRFFVYRGGWFL